MSAPRTDLEAMYSVDSVAEFNARRWGRLLSGRIDARQLAAAVVVQSRLRVRALFARAKGAPPPSAVDQLMHSVLLRGTHLQLVSSEADPSVDYL